MSRIINLSTPTIMESYWTAEDIQHAQLLGIVPKSMTTAHALSFLNQLDFEDIVRIEKREPPMQLVPRRPVKTKVRTSNSAFALLDDDSSSDEED